MPEFQFETFRSPRNFSWRRDPTPTIQQTTVDRFAFNDAADEALGTPDNVVLMFDRTRRVVGIRAARPEDPDKVKVTRPEVTCPYFSVKSFLIWANLKSGVNRLWSAEFVGDVLTFSARESEGTPKAADIGSFAGRR